MLSSDCYARIGGKRGSRCEPGTNGTPRTTPGYLYHLESTPSLSAATWTGVPGSSTNATGAAVTFSLPMSGDQTFYRTDSP